MVALGAAPRSATEHELHALLGELRDHALLVALLALYAMALLLLGLADRFPTLWQGVVSGLAVCALGGLVLALRGRSSRGSAVVAVGATLLAVLLLASGARVGGALSLLMLPVGLAALALGPGAAIAAAAVSSVAVLSLPGQLLTMDWSLRIASAMAAWLAAGMIWLTLRPLLSALEWSWASYEESRALLERVRDYQVQLKASLHDLGDANLQLTRLNRLAQGLRQEAEEARRAKEQFVANVSHELRTPLNMIVGFSEMIQQAPKAYGSQLPAALLADLDVIRRNAQHLAELIDDVLDLSQIEAGQLALTYERVSLHEIVEAALVAVRPLFTSKDLSLSAEVPKDLVLTCDRTRIREVVLNLLSNAGRFTDEGGAVVGAWRDGSDAIVSVTDTGPGIADEDQERLFRPFQQLDASLSRRHGGSGLGLAISRSFVELHGGRLWVESQQGEGTTFCFRLPLAPAPPPGASPVSRWFHSYWHYEARTRPSLAPTAQVRPRYVVWESGDVLQRLLGRYLGTAELAPVGSLEQAMDELARAPARALLVNDSSVPKALDRLVRGAPLPDGTPTIVCSVPGAYEAAGSLGANDYLVKPVSQDALLGALGRLKLGGNTVLVVDDEPDALRLFWRILGAAPQPYRVLTARNGREALNILQVERPDCLLVDLVMPEMDGFQLLAAKREMPAVRDVPAIVLSARDPAGQPIVTQALAVTRAGGLSMPQLLAGIEGLSGLLATAGQAGDPAPRAAPGA